MRTTPPSSSPGRDPRLSPGWSAPAAPNCSKARSGLRPAHGKVELNGKPVNFVTRPRQHRAGIVYLSEDRKGKGLLLGAELGINLTLAALASSCAGMLIDRRKEAKALDDSIVEFDIRTRNKDLLAGQLSGGNQQKLLLAKMMLLDHSFRSSSSTSRRAASTSAPRNRSTSSSPSSCARAENRSSSSRPRCRR
jgi:hypothetical protein